MQNYIDVARDVFGNSATLVAFIVGAIGILYMIVRVKTLPGSRNSLISGADIQEDIQTFGLEWEISGLEEKERIQKGIKNILSIWWPFFALLLISGFIQSFIFPLVFAGIVLTIFFFRYISTFIYTYQMKRYQINQDGIFIEKGEERGRYKWEEFEYFFGDADGRIYPEERGENKKVRERFIQEVQKVEGKTFFLKLKPTSMVSTILKNVLVLYTEPNNFETVKKVLSRKLPERNGLNITLVRYHFK